MFPEQVHCCVAGPGWKLKSVNHSHCCTQTHRVKKRAADVAVLFNKFVSDVTANNTFLSAKSGKKNNNKKNSTFELFQVEEVADQQLRGVISVNT